MKHRGVAIVGAVGLLPIAWGLVEHTMSIPEAAKRALIVLAVLWVLEVIVLPILAPMLRPQAGADGPPTPAELATDQQRSA